MPSEASRFAGTALAVTVADETTVDVAWTMVVKVSWRVEMTVVGMVTVSVWGVVEYSVKVLFQTQNQHHSRVAGRSA